MKNEPAPFTLNQKHFFDRCFHSWFNVAEGGKRGGKNVLTTLAFCALLEDHPNKIHLIAGVSLAAAKLNIIDCDGFGLLNYFDGRCREGEYKNRDCLYVNTRTGLKIVLISGGGKNGDEKLIKGNTYGMAYITEANECCPKFIQEVFDRTLSSADRKIFHDLNPKAPSHWYYTDVLAFHEKAKAQNQDYGYNYGHFTIADNMSVSDAKLSEVCKTYDKKSVWYKRDILGMRQAAEGAVYRFYTENKSCFEIPRPQRFFKDECGREKPFFRYLIAGLDFGGNKSRHSFVLSGITPDLKLYALYSAYLTAKDVTPAALYRWVSGQLEICRGLYGSVNALYADSAEQTLINGLRKRVGVAVYNSVKREIIDRIRATLQLMSEKRFFIVKDDCQTLDSALEAAVWDEDEQDDVRLDDGSSDIDTLDAFEYSFSFYLDYLTGRKGGNIP